MSEEQWSGSRAELELNRKLLRAEASYLEEEVDWLRARSELRLMYWRLARTALRTVPLILLGLGALAIFDAWFGAARVFRAWFL